jgi:two-component system response regulator AtoC
LGEKREHRVLIVDDDPIVLKSLGKMLEMNGYSIGCAADGRTALEMIERNGHDVILSDINMPEMNGFELLERVKEKCPESAFIIITGYGTIEDAVSAMKMGAYDFVTKPINDEEILTQIARFFQQRDLEQENATLRKELKSRYRLGNIIGQDYKMQKIYDLVELIADTQATVNIQGENGTGKSLLARAVHYNSCRRDKPFVEVSCGALPETLLESELFGHAKGAFTGAVRDRVGKFGQASGGTIFLDEIGAASSSLQLKLLRVLQERQFEPVGSNETVTVDVRVITATNTDLMELVRQNQFREDLYYRLNILQVHLPALRERVGDVRLLGEHFFQIYTRKYSKNLKGISAQSVKLLERYFWPGNVRELENVIERAVILSRGPYLTSENFPAAVIEAKPLTQAFKGVLPLSKALEEPEKRVIQNALEQCGWSRKKAAELLQINRTTLFKKMRRYGLLGR